MDFTSTIPASSFPTEEVGVRIFVADRHNADIQQGLLRIHGRRGASECCHSSVQLYTLLEKHIDISCLCSFHLSGCDLLKLSLSYKLLWFELFETRLQIVCSGYLAAWWPLGS